MKIYILLAIIFGSLAQPVFAEILTECFVSVRAEESITTSNDSSMMNGAALKFSDVRPGYSQFVFLLTGVDGTFTSFIRLLSDESPSSVFDFSLSGYEYKIPLISLDFWAYESDRNPSASTNTVMYWNKNDPDLGATAIFSTQVLGRNGSSKEVSLSCGPIGWTGLKKVA